MSGCARTSRRTRSDGKLPDRLFDLCADGGIGSLQRRFRARLCESLVLTLNLFRETD